MDSSVDPVRAPLLDVLTIDRWAARRAVAATLHRLPERMLVDRARGEAAAVRRAAERGHQASHACERR